MLRGFGLAALAVALSSIGAVANAQAMQVEHSNGMGVYHVAVCPRGNRHLTARCHAHLVTDAHGRALSGTMSPSLLAAPSGYGPADLRGAYKITGTGSTTVAIVDAFGYFKAEADLGVYRARYGLPPCTTANGCFRKLNQSGVQGSYPAMNLGWAQESALDLDMVSAMCPGCKIVLVEARSDTMSDLAAAERTAGSIPGVTAISNSYGGGESGAALYEPAYNQPGKAITVSTGDDGYGVEFPASSPHVIAVGGTHLIRASNARGWTESAWTSGGSGCSKLFAKPLFQTDALCTRRMESDVSAVADPNTGVAVYGPSTNIASGWMIFGGTSVSAPLIAGIYGVTGHKPTGAAGIYANKASLNDVARGTNGSCGGTYYCAAGVGYDGPSGNGSPNGPGAF